MDQKTTPKPEHFEYLDRLRKSGVTNMYGAGAYLQRQFGIERATASKILSAWMETFQDGVAAETRIANWTNSKITGGK